jgi:hypothetical protein
MCRCCRAHNIQYIADFESVKGYVARWVGWHVAHVLALFWPDAEEWSDSRIVVLLGVLVGVVGAHTDWRSSQSTTQMAAVA